jgi:two-component system capsular synthesis response regulator RcsB
VLLGLKEVTVLQIIIADDHPVILMGLTALLKDQGDAFNVIAEAHNGADLLRLLSERACDLVITDFSMPDDRGSIDGLPLLRRLRSDYPDLPVIVLTMLSNPALIKNMLGMGVRGIVDKAAFARELLTAMRAVSNGRTYMSENLRGTSDASIQRAETGHDEVTLSAREAEVVRLFAGGLTVTQIAEKIHRSVKTVSQQKNDAMRKLGMTSNSELYEYAKAHRLAP